MKNEKIRPDFSEMADAWGSPFVSRDKVEIFTGGLISRGYLANLDSNKTGPPEKIRVSRKICYPVKSFVKWLEDRSEVIENG